MLTKEELAKANLSEEEVQADEKDEGELNKHVSRSPEEIRTMFVEQAKEDGLDLDDEKTKKYIERMTSREIENSKRLSKTIGQKIKYRTSLFGIVGNKEEKKEEKKDEKNNEDQNKNLTDLQRIQQSLLVKALSKRLPEYVKLANEEGLTADQIHEGLKKHFKSTESDVTIEDFEKNLDSAFRQEYPSLYEEQIRREERKKLGEEDDEPEDMQDAGGGSGKKTETKKRFFPKQVPVKDWYKKKQ